MKLHDAQSMAAFAITELEAHCEHIAVAGSIRRRRPHVNDIDLVILPRGEDGRAAIARRFALTCSRIKGGEQYEVFMSPNGWQFDLWFAHGPQSDLLSTTPGNWGMLLLARTGSLHHNIYLASRARERGLHFNPHKGIMRGTEVLASETEAAIFAALELPFIPPEERER